LKDNIVVNFASSLLWWG